MVTEVGILAEDFRQLFSGLERAHGTYNLSDPEFRDNGKQIGRALTKHEPVTIELWKNHLGGRLGLGIIPIRDGDTAVFGAIDVDVYQGTSHKDIARKLANAKLPLAVCRSKSGGAHIFCFSREPVPASNMQTKLKEIASFLGFGGCEIFPKQTKIMSSQGDVGQWINMPYFNGVRGMRYCVNIDGDALTPEQFIEFAMSIRVEKDWFSKLVVVQNEFVDGPPCLQTLAQLTYPDGTRNDGLFNIGVYLRKAHPDSWEQELDTYNHRYMSPPLSMTEVQGVVKSLRRKTYAYACSKSPINAHCNAALCRTREHGVGGGGGGRFPTLGGLTMLATNPPVWFWSVDDHRIEFTTAEMQDPRAFQRKCMEALHYMPPIPTTPIWQAAINHAMESLTIVEAPEDASPDGQFWAMVEKFCSGRAQAQNRSEILLGKPFTDDAEKKTYFRMQDLLSFLDRHKFRTFAVNKVASLLKDHGAKHSVTTISGKTLNLWSIQSFARQTKGFDVPDSVKEGEAPF